MIFSSYSFLGFFTVVFIVFVILNKLKLYSVSELWLELASGMELAGLLYLGYHKRHLRLHGSPYGEEDIRRFWKEIAEITDFWDFTGYNVISEDARNFYDPMHYRNNAGTIILARIFGNKEVEVPDNFGRYVTKENVDKLLDVMTFKY